MLHAIVDEGQQFWHPSVLAISPCEHEAHFRESSSTVCFVEVVCFQLGPAPCPCRLAECWKAGRVMHRCCQQERDSSGYECSLSRRWDHHPSVQHACVCMFRRQKSHGFNLELLGGLGLPARLGNKNIVMMSSQDRGYTNTRNRERDV